MEPLEALLPPCGASSLGVGHAIYGRGHEHSRYTIQPNSRALSFAPRQARLRNSDSVTGVRKSSLFEILFARSWGEFGRLKYVTL
jgi:hypothetical protein